jgi:hypothetical protein
MPSEEYTGVVEERLDVEGDVVVAGVLRRGATVRGTLHLGGVCGETILVKEGGEVIIHGVLSAPLIVDAGGTATIRGIASGAIRKAPEGRVLAGVGAILKGHELTSDGSLRRLRDGQSVTVYEDMPLCALQDDGTWVPVSEGSMS